jgi:hypothetical protein
MRGSEHQPAPIQFRPRFDFADLQPHVIEINLKFTPVGRHPPSRAFPFGGFFNVAFPQSS